MEKILVINEHSDWLLRKEQEEINENEFVKWNQMVNEFPKNSNAKAFEDINYQEIYSYLTKERKVLKEIRRLLNWKRWAD